MSMAITIFPFFSPLTPEDRRNPILDNLRINGVELLQPEDYSKRTSHISPSKQVYILVGSGGTENLIESFIEANSLKSPILLLSFSFNNSLPAAMEVRAALEQKGVESRIIHSSLEDLETQFEKRANFASIIAIIGRSKLGIIGEPSHWLIASRVSDAAVKAQWGLTIEHYPMEILLSRIDDDLDDSTKKRLSAFKKEAICTDIAENEIEKAAKVAHQLAKIAETEVLDAITVECFDLLMQTHISGCYALSTLNERDSFAAGCEGDIPSTFTMLLAKLLLGSPGFMANVIDVDESLNEATFAHCTVPTSLTNSYRIMTHFETGLSLGLRGKFDPKRITVVKVSGDDLTRYWVSGGEIIKNLESETGCRTQIRAKMDEPVTYFLRGSLANHHIVIPGDHVEEVESFFSFALEGW
ncbi:MAG: hypothetical protein ACFFD6_11655 [Candidatus Thorarchaeota archaeon]